MRRVRAWSVALLAAGFSGALVPVAAAQAGPAADACGPAMPLADAIARAAARFAIAEALIHSVIAAESNFMVRAVSPKGAMGLMQLMPGTWAELRLRYALGADPFEPCDNIMAGTAYLRELLDRYGDPGFLAAYNAGPGRYEAYLRGARWLPAETRAYVARLSSEPLGGPPAAPSLAADPEGWRRGGLFVADAGSAAQPSPPPPRRGAAGSGHSDEVRPSEASSHTIFVARTRVPQ